MTVADFTITEMRSQTALDDHNRPYDAIRVSFTTARGDALFVDIPARGFTAELAKQKVAAMVAEINKVRGS